MASPRFQSFCCFQDAASAGLVSLNTAAYHRLSVACAFLSLIGVGVHNLPRLWSEYRRRRLKRADPPRPGSQDRVAFIITACNFVGCAESVTPSSLNCALTGILVRSAVWLSFIQQALPREQTVWLGSFCVLSSLWIQFFLQGAQVWWTLFYAIEVYRQVQEPTTPRVDSPEAAERLLHCQREAPDEKHQATLPEDHGRLYCVAVLNPMYAFLQSLAFHKWTGCGLDVCTWGLYCKVEQCCCRGKGEEEEGETESESEVTMENILKPQSMVGHWDSLNRQVQQPASQSGRSEVETASSVLHTPLHSTQ
ncbi:G-protein coupled receptor 143 [Acipenser ruthenus]|uniref:G-protein coupled receptor 143 n=1 Tax=Acipenser ruthenus TaxID=7906 RepID=A0A444UVS1_ACIRT|nr:G-protein coupled receptor 143 [Acipenser ruthenus]